MPEPIKETVYCVARGKQAISSYYEVRQNAALDLIRIEQSMRDAMLEPDVYLATVQKTTTYGDPEPVKP
ncbi:hypothetical protein [Curtobacterium flaccumfaciens]|uniref:hypothetical protein n=1 Tax=Curtobacterium flaccumfaciens TaxID=2035 RepID=UPI001ADBFA23|nr:hypothetical protein [Curtobacterium flaccumfaciens]MBO9043481.1 hypothetical protein [Curtobacterium flaccumfaciens pv. flaccumfaciens]